MNDSSDELDKAIRQVNEIADFNFRYLQKEQKGIIEYLNKLDERLKIIESKIQKPVFF